MRIKLSYIITMLLLAAVQVVCAQPRSDIDQAREGLGYFDKEALVKSKEFIRKDSTYYVGHMYEGAYRYYRASDVLGYDNAAKPLQKAMDLLLKDYSRKLKVRSSDIMSFVDAYKFQYDYCVIVGLLEECYRNIERPDKAMKVLLDMRNRNLQKEYYGDAYTTIAWIYHRSRMFTSEKYPFLGNSIEENDSIALAYCDSAVMKYKKFKSLNSQVFPKDYVEDDLFRVYHYKSLIHAYEMQIDSAEKYYQLLMQKDYFPNNNYATWKLTLGNFAEAEEYYKKAQERDYTDKRIREANYMLSMINIYQSKPKEGIKMLQDMIQAQGSTPGFGWHNIALARSYYYEGLTDESILSANKAAMFHELHIGTTWGQQQYDMAVSLLNYMNQERLIRSVKFENSGWWYSWSALTSLPGMYVKKYTSMLVLVNQFANNPERERVTYRLFSTESITTFDEIWSLIKGFSPEFFTKQFTKYLESDKRPRIKKYYRYFIARYLLDKDETKKAKELLNMVLDDPTLDKENEKLLIARVYEALATASDKDDENAVRDLYVMKLYKEYPQLLPFTELEMKFKINVGATGSETEEKMIEELKDCSVDWDGDDTWPTVNISFSTNSKKLREVNYEVTSSSGEILVPRSSFILSNAKESGKKLAYRLFNITKP